MRDNPLRQVTTQRVNGTNATSVRLALLFAISAALLLAAAPSANAGTPLKNGAWIATARVLVAGNPAAEDGSLSQHPKPPLETVSPYWGNYAAIGLASTQGAGKVLLAEEWLEWYRGKVKSSGVMSKYELDPQGTDPESYTATAIDDEYDVNTDSPAAYAATHLLAMWEYREAVGKKKIKKHKKQIRSSALLLVRQIDAIGAGGDGLVWSHPPDPVDPSAPTGKMKTIITQAESYAALRAATILLTDVDYGTASGLAAAGADEIKIGVESLWLPGVGAYATLKDEDHNLHVTDWSTWYADALGQAWVVAIGNGLNPGADLIDPSIHPTRAADLMNTLTSTWPEWNRPGFKPSFGRTAGTSSGLIGYQPMVGVALTEVGLTSQATAGVTNINDYALAKARKWPFTVGNAGQILLTLPGE